MCVCVRVCARVRVCLLKRQNILFFVSADANDACLGTAGSSSCACQPGYSGKPCTGY